MKLIFLKLFIFIMIVLSSLGFENKSIQAQDMELIEQQWNQFIESWNAMNTEGVLEIYTDNAVVIAPEMQSAKGKEAIAEFYNFLFSSNKSADYSHKTESISVEGSQAIEYGNFSVDWVSNEDQSWTYRARVMVHWVKDSSENWKIQQLLFNTPPAQEP